MTNETNLPGHVRLSSPKSSSQVAWTLLSIVLAGGLLAVTIALFRSRSNLSDCQNERTSLEHEIRQKQALADSIKWSGQLAAETSKTQLLTNENNRLRERMALDSTTRMSELELMRSINRRYSRQR